MKKLLIISLLFISTAPLYALGKIDPDVLSNEKEKSARYFVPFKTKPLSVLIFLNSASESQGVVDFLNGMPGVRASQVGFMPVIAAIMPRNKTLLNRIVENNAVAQISTNQPGSEELEVSAQALLLKSSPSHPQVNSWWNNGYTGKSGVVGLLDSGVATTHPSLATKKIIVHKEADSGYSEYTDGIRSAHGTGVACIYSGMGNSFFPNDLGIAFGADTIVTGLAGEGDGQFSDLLQTLTSMDWILKKAPIKPTVINYSFGNGKIYCASCPDWSGLAKTVDYAINHEKILWVKSAGNIGYIKPNSEAPFVNTMTAPADNYNGITVANMNPTIVKDGVGIQTADRSLHTISYKSSRGPTVNGRKKPDITAPGNDTWTCAPDPEQYRFNYSEAMHYLNGYRFMGGTSSAAPHVGAAILLMQDAGIKAPLLAKALLLNSADAWTDNNLPGPNKAAQTSNVHYPIMGSHWDRTYGWGYMNLEKAYNERNNLIESQLSVAEPFKEYRLTLPVGGKVTLVHERRVGYLEDNTEWKLSHLKLELYDANTGVLIMKDDSPIDNVHQVANCERAGGERVCSASNKEIDAIVRVELLSPRIDGSEAEPFALASSVPFK